MKTIEKRIIDFLRESDFLSVSAVCGKSRRLSPRDSITLQKAQKRVYLHGNCIFTLDKENNIKFSFQGWQTNTTKRRISALLSAFLPYPVFMHQRNYQLVFSSYSGEFPVDPDKIYTVKDGRPEEIESI